MFMRKIHIFIKNKQKVGVYETSVIACYSLEWRWKFVLWLLAS